MAQQRFLGDQVGLAPGQIDHGPDQDGRGRGSERALDDSVGKPTDRGDDKVRSGDSGVFIRRSRYSRWTSALLIPVRALGSPGFWLRMSAGSQQTSFFELLIQIL